MQRHSQLKKNTIKPAVTVKLKRPHRLLSGLIGLIFIVSLVGRLTVLNGSFMVRAVQNPVVINQAQQQLQTQMTANHLPTGLISNQLIRTVLTTGVEETYAGSALNFDVPAVKRAIQDDLNQQMATVGLSGGSGSAVTSVISGPVLTTFSQSIQTDQLNDFADHIRQSQLLADVVIAVSGLGWGGLMVSNHRRRQLRRLAAQSDR